LGGLAGASFVTTDSVGNFKCTYEQLLVQPDKKLFMMAGNKTAGNKVTVYDPFTDINKKLASVIPFRPLDADRYLQHAQEMLINDLGKVKQLAVVTVTAIQNRDASIYSTINACGDYVCVGNKLNCYKHAGDRNNRAPVKGKVYFMNGGSSITYWGCLLDENTGLEHDGIKTGKEFYIEDYSEKTTGNPEYISTLYWSPMLVFDKEGKAECSFYTSDITGRFRITVNGISDDNLYHATASFEVK
jgi:hypothetical protein